MRSSNCSLSMAMPVICQSCHSPHGLSLHQPLPPKSIICLAAREFSKLQSAPDTAQNPPMAPYCLQGTQGPQPGISSLPPSESSCGWLSKLLSPSLLSTYTDDLGSWNFLPLCSRRCCSFSLEFPQTPGLSTDGGSSAEALGEVLARLLSGSTLAQG